MATNLKGIVINMKSLSQHIENPIVVGGGDADGRYLTIIFTQEAAAQFSPSTKVYLSWRHIQKEIKGYNVFTEIPREDTDELTAEEQPPMWYIYLPKTLLYEGDVIATIELVDEISVAASTTFTIRVLENPWAESDWIANDDLSEFKTAMLKAQTLEDRINDDHRKLEWAIRKLCEMFDITDFVDENGDGIPDETTTEIDPTELDPDLGLNIVNWTGGDG